MELMNLCLQLHELLNEQVPDDDDEKADHDFDLIKHDSKCDYSDSEKGIQIDVDKIIGSTQGEVWRTFKNEVWMVKVY